MKFTSRQLSGCFNEIISFFSLLFLNFNHFSSQEKTMIINFYYIQRSSNFRKVVETDQIAALTWALFGVLNVRLLNEGGHRLKKL